MTVVAAGPALHARVILRAGLTLMQAATDAMHDLGWPSATMLLLGGPMQRAVFHTSVLTPDGQRWIDYGPPREVRAPAWLVMGSATFGIALDGGTALHCHAVFAGPDGLCGGHLASQACVLGSAGIVAHLTAAIGARFQVARDASGFDLLTPVAA